MSRAPGEVKRRWTPAKLAKAVAENYFINVKRPSAKRRIKGAKRVFADTEKNPDDIFLDTVIMPDGNRVQVRISGDQQTVLETLINDAGMSEADAVYAVQNFGITKDSFNTLYQFYLDGGDPTTLTDPSTIEIWNQIAPEFPSIKAPRVRTVKVIPNLDWYVILARAVRKPDELQESTKSKKSKGKGKGGKSKGQTLRERFNDLPSDKGMNVSGLKPDGKGAKTVSKSTDKSGLVTMTIDGKDLYSNKYAPLELVIIKLFGEEGRVKYARELKVAQESFMAAAQPPSAATEMKVQFTTPSAKRPVNISRPVKTVNA